MVLPCAHALTKVAHKGEEMNRSQNSLALTYKDAAVLVGVEYRTIKLGVERGTIPTVQLGPRRMIARAALLKIFGVEP